MKANTLALSLAAGLLPSALLAQGLDPALLTKPPVDAWPTHHGDYSGRRYSTLKEINARTVKSLALAWVYRANTSQGGAIIGGEGPEAPTPGGGMAAFGGLSIKSTPLLVNGVLYFSAPDHVWAVDARTGREIWHYFWRTRGGIHIGNRGVGMYGNWLYFLTPDNYFVSLDATTGKERWHHEIASIKREYFSTAAPIIVRNHVILGVGGDSLDVPGYLESRDPETGEVQWRWYTTPRAGEPGSETWPDEYSAAHGGGMPWVPGTYDPELNLYYFGTGNANPVLAGQSRAGDNLWTCSIVAINPDTGKMAWYFQATPHDTHDWDAAQVPILIDGVIDGKPRKLIAQANRNGHFFVLDRTNGKHVVTAPFIDTINWTKGVDRTGRPIPNPAKDASVPGTFVSPTTDGATNWPPPSFDPDTGLFYVGTHEAFSVFYLTDTDPRPQGWGAAERHIASVAGSLKAIDYKTGKVRWSHPLAMNAGGYGGGPMGLLSTAGGLLFGNDGGGNFVAYDVATGKPLWHAGLGANTSNGPQTFMLDGKQYVVVGAGDSLFSFALQ
ncbi:MAG: acido-empty-quinoprotein group A [Acidobacteria bacterium]|nr:MAG: acido-empty-quinoprotein group A [Acidobacteriota bacterium]